MKSTIPTAREYLKPKVMLLPPQADTAAVRSTADVLDMDTDARPSYIRKAAATPVFHKKK